MMIKNKNEYECIYFHARPPYCTVARARMIKMRKESAWGVYNNKSVSSWMEGVQRDTIAIIARLSAKRLARAAQNEQRESEDEKKKKNRRKDTCIRVLSEKETATGFRSKFTIVKQREAVGEQACRRRPGHGRHWLWAFAAGGARPRRCRALTSKNTLITVHGFIQFFATEPPRGSDLSRRSPRTRYKIVFGNDNGQTDAPSCKVFIDFSVTLKIRPRSNFFVPKSLTGSGQANKYL